MTASTPRMVAAPRLSDSDTGTLAVATRMMWASGQPRAGYVRSTSRNCQRRTDRLQAPKATVTFIGLRGRKMVRRMDSMDSLPRLSPEMRSHVTGDARKLALREREPAERCPSLARPEILARRRVRTIQYPFDANLANPARHQCCVSR